MHCPSEPKPCDCGCGYLSSGYVMVKSPGHPRADKRGYVFEHILVAEKALGRPLLLPAAVHHVNGNKQDNSPDNLVVCQDDGYHKLIHLRTRALAACGDAKAHRCCICHGYEDQSDITVVNGRRGWHRMYHRRCNALQGCENRKKASQRRASA